MTPVEIWKIRVEGYGTFDLRGTEAEAEEMRRHKGRWERGNAIKWRADLSTEVDCLTGKLAEAWDSGKGAPLSLLHKIRDAKRARDRAIALAEQEAKP